MTLAEANHALSCADCHDPEAVAAALTERGRALTEFAASASADLLAETLEAGAAFRDRLEFAQIEIRRELDGMTKLSRGLQSTLDAQQADCDRITCFG